jgi:PadR family transcriptional regulator PadR
MRKRRRLSDTSAAVLALFLNEPERERFGLDILKDTGIPSGSLYPILHRMEREGLLIAKWEPLEDATSNGRRPRRLYRLDKFRADSASDALEEWRAAQRRAAAAPSVRPRPA